MSHKTKFLQVGVFLSRKGGGGGTWWALLDLYLGIEVPLGV